MSGPAPRRSATQRDAVLAAIDALPGFVTVLELHRRMRQEGRQVSLKTVYRAVAGLAAADLIETAALRGAEWSTGRDRRPAGLVC